jgi:hypothetical protein
MTRPTASSGASRRFFPRTWRLPVVKTRDFEGDWISMAPGEKTKSMFYADDRVFWGLNRGRCA